MIRKSPTIRKLSKTLKKSPWLNVHREESELHDDKAQPAGLETCGMRPRWPFEGNRRDRLGDEEKG